MKKAEIIIEKAEEEDMGWVKNIIKKHGWKCASLEYVLVARADGHLAGMARAEFFRGKKLATIAGVFVQPAMRGKGIGIRLVREVIKSHPGVIKWHVAGKSWIEKFYTQIGFKKIPDVIPELKRDFEGQIFMVFERK